MLVFVVPVKSPEVSTSWSRLTILFERCLRSLCNQRNGAFRVVVVCNVVPEILWWDSRISVVVTDLPSPLPTREGKNSDKTLKILKGIAYAKQQGYFSGGGFVMPVDADDMVSCHLASFVEPFLSDPSIPGWSLTRGYLCKEGSRIAYLNRKNFNHSCGSSAIFRPELADALIYNHPSYDEGGVDFLRYNFEQPKVSLPALPFPGAVYSILNGENIFLTNGTMASHRTGYGSTLRYYATKALKYVPMSVTNRFRNEFRYVSAADSIGSAPRRPIQ